ncbi:hypothetical protein GGQ91_002487 [Methylobacterium fujisawaense]|uniref:Uncharacterized protein n=1 Tax=Methylobacterium fujisawaense TaxID=107400 RepID=A0ABR6DCN7_9HYPH|nr:hypothetical protein [Methylobacterium fujisawaense]MBA9063099.1 hypothetical protein [Methylobacterium fujisawaense]
MPDADVMRARSAFDELLRFESRGPGDTANAMRRIATRAAIPFGKLWALRYRPPKEIASHVLARIEAAHAAAKRQQLERLAHDVAITAHIAGAAHPAVREGEALLRAAGGPAEGAAPRVVRAARQQAPTHPLELTDLPLWRAANEED